jgi:hypothetical protein
MDHPVCFSLWAKIDEQIERTDHLIAMLPEGGLDFTPEIPGVWSAGVLLGHLLDCLGGFCAVLYAASPERLSHFEQLRQLPVNHRCGANEARERIGLYRAKIGEGFGTLRDSDLTRCLPTVFVSAGEPVATLLLGNLEHLINHKHQLFMYLKLMGVSAGTPDLYKLR